MDLITRRRNSKEEPPKFSASPVSFNDWFKTNKATLESTVSELKETAVKLNHVKGATQKAAVGVAAVVGVVLGRLAAPVTGGGFGPAAAAGFVSGGGAAATIAAAVAVTAVVAGVVVGAGVAASVAVSGAAAAVGAGAAYRIGKKREEEHVTKAEALWETFCTLMEALRNLEDEKRSYERLKKNNDNLMELQTTIQDLWSTQNAPGSTPPSDWIRELVQKCQTTLEQLELVSADLAEH